MFSPRQESANAKAEGNDDAADVSCKSNLILSSTFLTAYMMDLVLTQKTTFSYLRQEDEDDDGKAAGASDEEKKDASAAEKPQQASADEKVEEISKDASSSSDKKDEL